MSSKRKFECGNIKRQKKKRIDELIKSQRGALDKFILKEPQVPNENQHIETNGDEAILDVDTHGCDIETNGNGAIEGEVVGGEATSLEFIGVEAPSVEVNITCSTDDPEHDVNNIVDSENDDDSNFNYVNHDVDANIDNSHVHNLFDPRIWDSLDSKQIDILVGKGLKRDMSIQKGPKDKYSRRFSSEFYTRVLSNGEKVDRDWLVYSKELDKVFCFCCKIFKKGKGQLVNVGFGDWRHLGNRLKEHETSIDHVTNMTTWYELRVRLQTENTIDKVAQKQLEKEKDHWRNVLVRIIAMVKYLAKHSLAFRGSSEKLFLNNNGNFLGLIEMLNEFDPIIKKHVERIEKEKIHFHYLGHRIQNELILLLSSTIKSDIIKRVKHAKYFSVILDCTPDVSHQEQMSLILRYVDVSSSSVIIEESFLGFLEVDDTTGQGLFNVLQAELKSLDLDIDNVRGQSYDNGSNMKGKNLGVQKRLLDINPRAFHTSCASHSLNLTLCDMANTCAKARNFFGIIQRIYTMFANSTKRWKIFKDNVKGLTVKSLSFTRWESRVDSVKAIRFQIVEVREALLEVADSETDPGTSSEAKSLAKNELGDFEFLVSIVIWYEILYAINLVSKDLQSKDMLIDVAIEKIQGLISFFKNYRETGYLNALKIAKEIASTMGVDPVFPQKRQIRRKKHFDENPDEVIVRSEEDSFKINFFYFVVDEAIGSLAKRFEQYEEYENNFGFLFNSHKLYSLDDARLKSSCNIIEAALKKHEQCDINGSELYVELKILQDALSKEVMQPIDILKHLKRVGCFPNAYIVYRILLTIPVTVAFAERSFSKLKLLKSYLRSTMTQERLNGLALISIVKDLLDKVDCKELIESFVANNVRRMTLF